MAEDQNKGLTEAIVANTAKATKIMTPKHETTDSDRAWSRRPERLSSVITDNDGEYEYRALPRSGFDFEKEPSSSDSPPYDIHVFG